MISNSLSYNHQDDVFSTHHKRLNKLEATVKSVEEKIEQLEKEKEREKQRSEKCEPFSTNISIQA